MNLRQALIDQAPSLALQRAAQAEIARLDAEVRKWERIALAQNSKLMAMADVPGSMDRLRDVLAAARGDALAEGDTEGGDHS